MAPVAQWVDTQLSDARLLAAPLGTPATSRAVQLDAHAYVEQEVFLQGRAQHYRPGPAGVNRASGPSSLMAKPTLTSPGCWCGARLTRRASMA